MAQRHIQDCVQYVPVYKGVSACLSVFECVLILFMVCVSGRWIQINLMEVSRVKTNSSMYGSSNVVSMYSCVSCRCVSKDVSYLRPSMTYFGTMLVLCKNFKI